METEYDPAYTVEKDAQDRLGMTLSRDGQTIEQAIAVRIPKHLSAASQSELPSLIARTELEFCVFSSEQEPSIRWPKSGWLRGGIDELAACIEQAAMSENSVAQGMLLLEEGIGQASNILRDACADAPDTLKTIALELHQEDGKQTTRMAMAILANALTFHTAIAGAHEIPTLDQVRSTNGSLPKSNILRVWRYILTEINYWPIFQIASKVLLPIQNGTARRILDKLADVVAELDSLGATSQHDLHGRMFQRLISDRKFLATFYTLPNSAALLAELAVSRLKVDWSDREVVTSLRVVDFACGTGALLNAAYSSMMERYRRTGKDDREIHSQMMEHVLFGADIMPAASHLTATVLSSAHPSVPFKNTSIITMPYGEQPDKSGIPVSLGALDLIGGESTLPLFGTGQTRVRGVEGKNEIDLDMPHGSFDLVIMNPPFTRPTNHESTDVPVPSFAGFATSNDEQKIMSGLLSKARKPGMAGHGNAGLASNFIDIGHAKVKPGGVLALVLPGSFLQGEAWVSARTLVESHYRDIMIVSIASTGSTDRAFSADTGMAEVLLIAKRKTVVEQESIVTFINLVRRPRTILEASTLARSVNNIPADQGIGLIKLGTEDNAGCYIMNAMSEMGGAGVKEVGVANAAANLARGVLKLPRDSETVTIPVTALSDLGHRGLLDRDLNGPELAKNGFPRGPFDIVKVGAGIPTWPSLWSHSAARETRLVVEPDCQGQARRGCDARAVEAWAKTASRLHFNRDFQINSQPLAACMTPEQTIGGRAWPNFLCADKRWEAPLVLWSNTTLGLIAFWWIGTRQQQGRATLTISKLPALTVLDVRQLSPELLSRADAIFQNFKSKNFLPANEAWRDETRIALDYAVLTDLMGLQSEKIEFLDLLRRQWCAEPSVHGGKKTAPENAG